MDSEKIKEIKKVLNTWKVVFHGITNTDILTLINEFERENERLLEQRNKTYNIWVKDTEQLKNRIAELEKRCHFIWALGCDYDGYEKAESLKSLIDELVGIAQGSWGDVCSKCENKQDNLINNVLKRFAERLFEKYSYDKLTHEPDEDIEIHLTASELDETLKEFINGKV